MPALYLSEDDVAWLLDVPTAIDVVENGFREWQAGRAENQPRRRVASEGAILHVMSAAAPFAGFLGYKAYLTTRLHARFHVVLYEQAAGMLAAVIEANLLGQIRTGAATGVATRAMARPDAAVVGCFGTGFQARAQLQAVCAVRKIETIEVYSKNEERRTQFAAQMTELCNVPVKAMNMPDEVAAEKDIVITATTSKAPVFDGRVLDEGTHLNVIGSNWLTKSEVDLTTIRRADHIVCDSIEACQVEAGDFVPALESGDLEWSRVHELADVLTGLETGRACPEDITLFKSVGLALEDVAVAAHVLQRARKEGIGQALPF
jgi:ornithine cyclodeaminase/alanine dehydrogenase-like protein (mu-crystallin family)